MLTSLEAEIPLHFNCNSICPAADTKFSAWCCMVFFLASSYISISWWSFYLLTSSHIHRWCANQTFGISLPFQKIFVPNLSQWRCCTAVNSSIMSSATMEILIPNVTGDEACKVFSLSFLVTVNSWVAKVFNGKTIPLVNSVLSGFR